MPRLTPALAAALLCALALAAPAAAVPKGATWSEAWIDAADGTRLHADVLRPAGLPADARTPVIAVVSPYLGHSKVGESTTGDPTATPGPSARFDDFFDGARVFERGYSVVMVDLRGSGGSSGCLDILGPGEQADIVAAVEWAAAQPWSTGRVGMYGKSYDGNTGMAATALRPKGLHAVVAQQVTPDRYRSSYHGGVRYLQSLAYPSASYGAQAEAGFTFGDEPEYLVNSLARSADCQAALAEHYSNDPSIEFWRGRNFVERAKGSTVPLLQTSGFLDANTNIGGGSLEHWAGMAGDKRLWLGWWAHVRGNDKDGAKLAMGRPGWFDEVMRFYDRHLKQLDAAQAPTDRDPRVAVQGSDGGWRAEAAWPPADAQPFSLPLGAGSYADDGENNGSADSAAGAGGAGMGGGYGAGVWSTTAPLPHDAHLAGIPRATVDVAPAVPASNLVVNVYDVAPGGEATMVTRGARLVDGAGPAELQLYPSDWRFAAGHRIAALVSGANSEAFLHLPTQTTVAVAGGAVVLPLLRERRDVALPGDPAPRLKAYRAAAPFDVAADVLRAAERAEVVPPAQVAATTTVTPGPVVTAKGRLTVRLAVRRGVATISGRAPRGSLVRLVLARGQRTLARRATTAPRGTFRVRVRVRGAVRALRVRATTRTGAGVLRASARRR